MHLARIVIKNFRRIEEADIHLSNATFLIGQNNFGKSSAIRCLELLLSNQSPEAADFRKDAEGNSSETITLTGYFEGIEAEVANARGFRGRVVGGAYCYRKTYSLTNPGKPRIECLEYPYTVREVYRAARTGDDLAALGIEAERVQEVVKPNGTLKPNWERDLLDLVADFDTAAEPVWVENPGGFSSVVISRLPRLIHVPPLTKHDEVGDGNKGKTLIAEVLGILFEDLLEDNTVAQEAQERLSALEAQMSPDDDQSLISSLCTEVNRIIAGVFPGCGIKVSSSLQDLAAVLKPKYEVSMFSNVYTDVARQGTGLLRTAIFSMFRYHTRLHEERERHTRPLLVAFEEPEIYLHPSAANLLRDTIYGLGRTDQIFCTTHSPWMIDLSKDLQSLTKMVLNAEGYLRAVNYGVSAELARLEADDRRRVKMLQLFDDEVSRVFFAERVVVVEGDSERVALKATIDLLPEEQRKEVLARVQIVKARGKAAIISLVRYLRALSIEPYVIHDRDQGTAGAEVFNQPIADAVGAPARVTMLHECIEDVLGYPAPSSDKPYRVYERASGWAALADAPERWQEVFLWAMGL